MSYPLGRNRSRGQIPCVNVRSGPAHLGWGAGGLRSVGPAHAHISRVHPNCALEHPYRVPFLQHISTCPHHISSDLGPPPSHFVLTPSMKLGGGGTKQTVLPEILN